MLFTARLAAAVQLVRRLITRPASPVLDYCEGCEGVSGLPPVTSMSYCAECARIACDAGEGPAVGLPVPPDIEAAIAALEAHRCDDDPCDDARRCPVCVFGSACCGECGEWMDDLGAEAFGLHRLVVENWVAVGCEGYLTPVVRAAWAVRAASDTPAA